jgi:hypothetical protein
MLNKNTDSFVIWFGLRTRATRQVREAAAETKKRSSTLSEWYSLRQGRGSTVCGKRRLA